MNELECKYCGDLTECSEEAVAVTCSYCVTLLLSGDLTKNNSEKDLTYMA